MLTGESTVKSTPFGNEDPQSWSSQTVWPSEFAFFSLPGFSREVLKRHTLALAPSSVSLHPRLADRFIAGSVGDGWVRIHDFESGEVKDTLKGHHGPAHAVSYSPDGELAASGSEDGE